MKNIVPFVSLVFALLFFSCGANVEKPAEELLVRARVEFENGSYNSARMLIDSMRIVSPKAYKALREGEVLRRQVLMKEKVRDVEFLENEIAAMSAVRDSMLAGYHLNKDARYHDKGYYTLPSQSASANRDNNYLRACVYEDGAMFLTSFYRGRKIGHTTVKLSSGDVYVSCNKPFLRRAYVDLGINNERCDYKHGEDGGMIDFILSAKGRIEVELSGGKGIVRYTLREADADAVGQMFRLAKVFEALAEYEQLLAEACYSLDFLRRSEALSSGAGVVDSLGVEDVAAIAE